MDWHAYCIDCKKSLDKAANGSFIETVGKVHKKEKPDHQVIVGYLVDLSKGKE